jgi:hypothetical protein
LLVVGCALAGQSQHGNVLANLLRESPGGDLVPEALHARALDPCEQLALQASLLLDAPQFALPLVLGVTSVVLLCAALKLGEEKCEARLERASALAEVSSVHRARRMEARREASHSPRCGRRRLLLSSPGEVEAFAFCASFQAASSASVCGTRSVCSTTSSA